MCSPKAFNLREKVVALRNCKLDPSRIYYLSLHVIGDPMFGQARMMRELTDAWLEKKMTMPGFAFTDKAPPLKQEDLDKIPGVKLALGGVDAMPLEVCVREGTLVVIQRDEDRFWVSQGGPITDQYLLLKANHESTYQNALTGLLKSSNSSSGMPDPLSAAAAEEDSSPPAPTDSLKEFSPNSAFYPYCYFYLVYLCCFLVR
jgi:hypothetical protein